jgi:hypothetical protein
MSDGLFGPVWLKDRSNKGYGNTPLPQRRDEEIAELIMVWAELSERDRRGVESQISDDQSFTLICFGERMASLAVREQNSERLFLGLSALGIEGGKFDWRENWLIVPLHYDAAQRIGVEPVPLFEKAATLLSGTFARHLRDFLRRSASEKSISQMGFQIGNDEQGFRYKRAW